MRTTQNNHPETAGSILFGSCSWNYDSWEGLVYSKPAKTAAEYLPEYSRRFSTAEIDSTFYRIPSRSDMRAYRELTPDGFSFTCKVPQEITLTHKRNLKKSAVLETNPVFLSAERLKTFLEAMEPLLDRLDAVMFEFEYLNKTKMPSQSEFLDRLNDFFTKIPRGIPYALEPRNGPYLNEDYFDLIRKQDLIHVYSEKQYMPPVWEVHAGRKPVPEKTVVIRLLGGDRKEIEKKSGEKWNSIVFERPEKAHIAEMSRDMKFAGKKVIINVNNHYEGSAPLTISALETLVSEKK